MMTAAVIQVVEEFKVFCRINNLIMGEVCQLQGDPHCTVIQIYDTKDKDIRKEYHLKICALEANDPDCVDSCYLVAVYYEGRQVEYMSSTEKRLGEKARMLTGSIISEKSKRRIQWNIPKIRKKKV